MFPRIALVEDFWRVNSYGYPCFFSAQDNAKQAWRTFLSFFDYSQYVAVKDFWASGAAPWRLSSNAVESWKATFEEFGLLHVESGSNLVTITPGGIQLREAAERGDRDAFAWIGLQLLLRYPLRGPRRPKSPAHDGSDLLLYRFFFSALLDIGNHVWWTELERILCRVFSRSAAADAIADVSELRADPSLIARVPLPAERKGGFYNSINQVVVHAGMYHFLLGTDDLTCPYGVTEPRRRHSIRDEWIALVREALNFVDPHGQCGSGGSAVGRLPSAPALKNEHEYFEYLGAAVPVRSAPSGAAIPQVNLDGQDVILLSTPAHYQPSAGSIEGPMSILCRLGKGQRLILGHDEHWTYLVVDKTVIGAGVVRVHVRRARPITNIGIVRNLFGAPSDEGKSE